MPIEIGNPVQIFVYPAIPVGEGAGGAKQIHKDLETIFREIFTMRTSAMRDSNFSSVLQGRISQVTNLQDGIQLKLRSHIFGSIAGAINKQPPDEEIQHLKLSKQVADQLVEYLEAVKEKEMGSSAPAAIKLSTLGIWGGSWAAAAMLARNLFKDEALKSSLSCLKENMAGEWVDPALSKGALQKFQFYAESCSREQGYCDQLDYRVIAGCVFVACLVTFTIKVLMYQSMEVQEEKLRQKFQESNI